MEFLNTMWNNCEALKEAEAFYIDLANEATSHAPGSIGQEIRIRVLESQDVIEMMYQIVAVEQLWENQIDMYGRKLPAYKPDTIRKKAKLPYQTPDKLANYTEAWTFSFMNEGLYMYIDGEGDRFEFDNTLAKDYFQYIPREYIGMTQQNYERFHAQIDAMVWDEQRRYIQEQIDASPYADILNALRFIGYDFGH